MSPCLARAMAFAKQSVSLSRPGIRDAYEAAHP